MTDPLYDFIDTIFPEDLLTSQDHVCYWASKRAVPGFPTDEQGLERALSGKGERACYFGTSTVTLTDGALRNRQAAFSGLWVVVLDDIGDGTGAKCPRSALPSGVWEAASYRVETSPDNFQLGFVLDEPVRDLDCARELVRLVYNAGDWDSGGAMPTKLVRLPTGVNLKDKYKVKGEHFQVRLDHLSDVLFTPDELLTLVNAGVTWGDVQGGRSTKTDPRRTLGATAYQEGHRLDINGIVDPVLEWLNDNNLLLNERYPFVDIVCPWHEEHSEGGGNTAGYSPLGWGVDHYPITRGFNCFHDHCRARGGREFLDWVRGLGGPAAATVDPGGALARRWVLDCGANQWVDVESPALERVSMEGFRSLYAAEKVVFPKEGTDKWTKVKLSSLIYESSCLVRTVGRCFDPSGDLIVDVEHNRYINDCRLPWHAVEPERAAADVERLRDFIEYLLPARDDAEFFIRHMAAKAQRPHYRGPALFMHTPIEGTGRGTLQKILSRLWGHQNVKSPSLKALLKGLASEGFNSGLRGLWLMVSEAKQNTADELPRVHPEHYDNFKAFVEPAPTAVTYNEKYGGQWEEMNYSSVIICSNHSDGMLMSHRNRRVRRMENVIEKRPQSYFEELHAWIDDDGWLGNVWHYLLAYDLDGYTGYEPQDVNVSAEDFDTMLAQQSPIDMTLELIGTYCGERTGGIFCTASLIDTIHNDPMLVSRLGFSDMRTDWRRVLRKLLNRNSKELRDEDRRIPVKLGDGVVFFRAFTTPVGAQTRAECLAENWTSTDVKELWSGFTPAGMVSYLKERLEQLGLG